MATIEILAPVGGQTFRRTCDSDAEAMHKARLIETEFRSRGGIWVSFEAGNREVRDCFGPSLVWFPASSQVRICFDDEIPSGIDAFS